MVDLFPSKNYTLSAGILENQPKLHQPGVRFIYLDDDKTDSMRRRQAFSFAVLEMLQVTPAKKIALMQEHVIERRLQQILTILENGGAFLREELLKKGIKDEAGIEKIYRDVAYSTEDIIKEEPASSWYAPISAAYAAVLSCS